MKKVFLTVSVDVDMNDMAQKTADYIKDAFIDEIINYLGKKGICVLELEHSDKILDKFVQELAPLVAIILTEDNASE